MYVNRPYPAGTESDKPLPPVYRAWLACTEVQANGKPDSILLADQLTSSCFDIPEMTNCQIVISHTMDSCKTRSSFIPFKKFRRLRVNSAFYIIL